ETLIFREICNKKSIDLPFLVQCQSPNQPYTKGDNAHGHYTILTLCYSIPFPTELLVNQLHLQSSLSLPTMITKPKPLLSPTKPISKSTVSKAASRKLKHE